MIGPDVLIFHRPAAVDAPSLVRVLADVRERLVERQGALFKRAGAGTIRVETAWPAGATFGEVLAELAGQGRSGVVVMGSGAVPLLSATDARQLVGVAASGARRALTNNRYSSDVCAIGDASSLRKLPPLPSDNALPRWLEEHRRFTVDELPGRERLALDLDAPFDIALAGIARTGGWLRGFAARNSIEIPRYAAIRSLADDPLRELLVFGRSGSSTLRWLERNVRCRVRFLAEERGLRAGSELAIAGDGPRTTLRRRGPRSTLGMLVDQRGPGGLGAIVSELADGAVIDSRVLMAHRYGVDEDRWPPPADRFASDLLRGEQVADGWLRELTASAAGAELPILLGGHTLVGPGIRLLLAESRGAR